MVEFFELVASYWKKSKADWKHNRHRLYTLFAFVLIAYLVLEFGSYIFTSRLNHARMVDEIRNKFIDRRVDLADEYLRKFFLLKESARNLIVNQDKNNFSQDACNKLQLKYKIAELESDLFVSSPNLRYFFGDEIADHFAEFIAWFDKNDNNCFKDVENAETVVDQKTLAIRKMMWVKMYPPEVVEKLR